MAGTTSRLALFVALASATPFRPLLVRQEASSTVPITSAVSATEVPSSETTLASDLGITATLDDGIRLAAAVTDAEASLVCSLSSAGTVTGYSAITVSGTVETLWDFTIQPTILCDCNDGRGAGINTIVGGDGHSTLACALGLGTSTTLAVGTETPTSTPGEATNEGWADVSCEEDAFSSSANNPWEQ